VSTLIVEVCRIEKVQPHPNADALELAQIKGWQCVVPKGRYQSGSLVTYIPIDSVLPAELSDRLNITKYLSKGRVRCAKLRGEPSFGVIIDVENAGWKEGTDVREHYGITKYLPPLKATAGDALPPHPLFVSYTDVENLRNFPDVLTEGEEVSITEKLHGTNCRIGFVEGEWMAGSMEVRRAKPAEGQDLGNIYWSPLNVPGVRALIEELAAKHRQVILFGEVYGSKIQNLAYGKVGQLGFAAFDLLADGKYVDAAEFVERCSKHSVPMVPVLKRGPFHIEEVKAFSCGKTTLGADHIREGVVVKPVVERTHPKVGRVILKYIGDDYLFAKGVSDTNDV
jgi:RNA ligase (TIGR02306 family)